MKSTARLAASLALLTLSPAVALAQDDSPRVQVGLRAGFAGAVGDLYKDQSITEGSYGAIPFILDVGVRLNPHFYLGLFGQLAPVLLKADDEKGCPSEFDCSSTNYRFGVNADYHFSPASGVDPYLSLGVGYDMLKSSAKGSVDLGAGPMGFEVESTFRGFEFANLGGGVDFVVNRHFSIGPSLTFTVARYTTLDTTQTVEGQTLEGTDEPEPGTHFYGILALRGTFTL